MQAQILVPLDGSPRSAAILPLAIPLARAAGCGLTLVQALGLDTGTAMVGWPLPAEAIDDRQQSIRLAVADALAVTAQRLERPGWPVQTAALDGDPVRAILDYVADHPEVQLIALATHGRRGVNRWIFGSVAEEILHQAPVPVVLLRLPAGALPAGPEPVLRTIAVPLDGSAFAESALDQAQTLAQATGARLVLLTARPSLDEASLLTNEIPLWVQQQQQLETDRLVRYQENLAARLAAQGVKVGTQIGDGRAADVILHLSAESQADLIVMATHGRTGFQRLRLGSVALEVVERATPPVFLVRGPHDTPPAAALAAADAAPAGHVPGRVDTASAGTHS
ncbi:MAG TPA: universal stress protein [Chloroflexia bacterium]|nr:universal stress protein [Chloroflexia bacterium]